MKGHVEAVCTSEKKGVVKHAVPAIELKPGVGIVGDAHAGPWHRQVSLLPAESIATVRAILPDLEDGAFAENVITSGVDPKSAGVGARVFLGDAELEITQIGKKCHATCAIGVATGDCIMPREGVFCRVLRGGTLRAGDPIRIEPATDAPRTTD